MTRGTTPTYCFALPFEVSTLSGWCISFAQRGVEKFSVEEDDAGASAEGRVISLTLRQSDTLRLEAGVDVQIQLRALVAATGEAIASEILTAAVEPVLREGVLE